MNHPATIIKAAIARQGIHIGHVNFFTHKRKNGTTRIKMWQGDKFAAASVKKRKAVVDELRAEYGPRFASAYFIDTAEGCYVADQSFCLVLWRRE
jgi:hypothetical protein